MILKLIDFLREASNGTDDLDDSVSQIDTFLSKLEKESLKINLQGIIETMMGDEDPPPVVKTTIPDGQDLIDLINFLKNKLVKESSGILNDFLESEENVKTSKKLYHLLFSTMKKLRNCIERRKKNEKEYLETRKLASQNFIQKAIKKPGSLRKYYGVKDGEDIPVGLARKDYSRLKKKSKEGELTKSELSLLRKLSFYLNVLRPASRKKGK